MRKTLESKMIIDTHLTRSVFVRWVSLDWYSRQLLLCKHDGIVSKVDSDALTSVGDPGSAVAFV